MPNIHLRNVPDELYRRLTELAAKEHRSLPEAVLHLLEHALESQEFRHIQHKEAVENLRRRFPTRRPMDVSISELIREGRD